MSLRSKITDNTDHRELYRQCFTSLDIPINEMDVMIDIVHSILSYFVDTAFNVQTDQITLGSIGEAHSGASLDRGTIEHHPENQTADSRGNGLESDSNLRGTSEP